MYIYIYIHNLLYLILIYGLYKEGLFYLFTDDLIGFWNGTLKGGTLEDYQCFFQRRGHWV